ncbi:MAG: glycosyltransferase family 4 protein [Candidatus Komeilibacteria bacterium]|nr:glycosyltransferase family 4 protein [Candidatus Komeilibacteria bacterium]
MKRILIFATAYYPHVGGAEVAVKEITDRLPGYEFDLICARLEKNLPQQEKIGQVNVFRVGWGLPQIDKIYLAVCGYWLGLKLQRQKKYDLVWAIMASYGGFAALAFKLKTGVKYLLTLQEGDFNLKTKRKIWLVKKKFANIFSQADGLQAISNYLLNWGTAMGFKGLAEVVPNGVDVKNFTKVYEQSELKKVRDSWGFDRSAIILVSASRLVLKNGLADLIKALPLLPENFCLVLIGEGRLEKNLRQLADNLGLSSRIYFAGYHDHQELPRLLAAADIFIRPSLSEGLGNAFLEAMATRLPTIGTLVGGIPDFLTDGQTGLVCEPGNPQSISQAIVKASKLSVQEKQALHQNAMALIEKKYNWEYIAGRMDAIFKGLTA